MSVRRLTSSAAPAATARVDLVPHPRSQRWSHRAVALAEDSPVVRQAITVAGIAAVIAGLHTLLALRTGEDFAVYWKGGWSVLHGRSPYAPGFLDGGPFRSLPFTYPPFASLLFAPFALVAPAPAMALWTVGCLCALLLLVRLSFPLSASTRPRLVCTLVVIWSVCLLLRPVREGLALGQIGILITLACFADVTVARASWPRGALIGLATAVKLTPAVFLVHLALTRQWAALRNGLCTLAGCWGLAFALLPSASISYFFHGVMLDTGRVGAATAAYNQSLNGFIARSGLPEPRWWWLAACLAAAGLGLARARRAHRVGDLRTAAVLVGMVMLLVSPISWLHHAMWVIPLLGLLLTQRRDALLVAGAALVGFLLYVSSTANGWLLDGYLLCYAVSIIALPIASPGAGR